MPICEAISNSTFNGFLGDVRLERLAGRFLEKVIDGVTVCLRKLAGGRALEVAFGRLLSNDKFSIPSVCEASFRRTHQACLNIPHVLVVQDTSELCFEKGPHPRRNLGWLTSPFGYGFFFHPALAIEPTSKAVLGLCGMKMIERDLSKKKSPKQPVQERDFSYKKTPFDEKESSRWVDVAHEARSNLPDQTRITIVADRECDIFEAFCMIPSENTDLLIRATHSRKLQDEGLLFEKLHELDASGAYDIDLPPITGKRAARKATVLVRFGQFTFQPPQRWGAEKIKNPVTLTAIEVLESGTNPTGEKPICWRLLTSHVVSTLEEAKNVVGWYSMRWTIEQLFRTMKSDGLRVEESQIEKIEHLKKMAVVACEASVRILQLVAARDGHTNRPVDDAFDCEEQQVVENLIPRLEGTTAIQKNPHPHGSLARAAWVIARLGGWKGYSKSERPPGPITMRNGLEKFQQMRAGWMMARDVCIP